MIPGLQGRGMVLGLLWGVYAAAPTAAPLPELLIVLSLASGSGALLGGFWPSRIPLETAAEARPSRWLEVSSGVALALGLAALTAVGIATLRPMLPGWSGGGHALFAAVGAAATCWALLWLGRRSVAAGIGAVGLTLALVLALGAEGLRNQIGNRAAQIDQSTGIGPVSAAGRAASSQVERRNNLVLIVLDTVRADHLSTYGYPRPTAPFLDQFAEQGVLYGRAISPAPWTLPAHASIFTGLPPSQHGATSEHKRLDDDATTLGESLQAAGYETLGLTSNSSASSAHNLHQGFERFYEVFRPDPTAGARAVRRGLPGPLAGPVARTLPGRPADKGASEVNRLVSRWLDERSERGETRPFFLFANLLEAHLPYDPPEAIRQRFDYGPAPASLDGLLGRNWFRALFGRIGRGEVFTAGEQRALADRYDAAIAYQDERLAELIGLLDARFAREDLAIVVTSDHGENLGDHGLADHVFSLHQTLLHVPLLVRHPPEFPAGLEIEGLVSTASIYATLLEVAGLAANEDGGFLPAEPLPRAPDSKGATFVVSEEHLRVQEAATLVAEAPGADAAAWLMRFQAVQDQHRKVVQVGNREPVVFDLDLDPRELKPLSLGSREDAHSLAAVLAERRFEAPANDDGTVGSLDEVTRKSLEALGYLDDGSPGR